MRINIKLKSVNKFVPFSTSRSAPPIGYNARRCGARRLARPHPSVTTRDGAGRAVKILNRLHLKHMIFQHSIRPFQPLLM